MGCVELGTEGAEGRGQEAEGKEEGKRQRAGGRGERATNFAGFSHRGLLGLRVGQGARPILHRAKAIEIQVGDRLIYSSGCPIIRILTDRRFCSTGRCSRWANSYIHQTYAK
jgi:hypothetical protein